MKVKVCGTRDIENIEQLLQLPIDYIGFVFYSKSPRLVKEKSRLGAWIQDNPDKFGAVRRVGVFVNAEIEEILNKVHDYQLDYVQLHGDERPEYCRELSSFWKVSLIRRPEVIKAFAVGDDFDFAQTRAYHGACALFLFDAKGGAPGGTGRSFDWSLLAKYEGPTPFLLAGGIGPEMASDIRRLAHPQLLGVDINSRFEQEPGVKNIEWVRAFVNALKQDEPS